MSLNLLGFIYKKTVGQMISNVLLWSKTSDSNSGHEHDKARTLPLAEVR